MLDALDELSVGVAMARVRTEIADEIESSQIGARLVGEGVCLEVDDAVAAHRSRQSSEGHGGSC